MKRRPREELTIAKSMLERVEHAALRAEAAAALARGERVRLLRGGQGPEQRVETLVLEPSGRAAQSAGESVTRGEWRGGKLVADEGGHLLDADGFCFCRSCEAAGGYCVDDDE